MGGTIARFIVFWPLLTLFVKFEFSSIEIELIGVATLLVLWMLGEHVGKVLATGFTTVIVATLLLPPETSYGHQIAQSSGTNADVAPILHVVLDEHIGLAGLPTEIEPIKLLKEELEDFYREFSFRVYEKAYSQYSWTHNSMSNLFNFSEIDVDSSYFATSRGPFQLRRNEYFRHLTQQGYSIRVYQPVWMQYCEAENANITSCSTYPNFFWGGLADKKLAATEKARLIAGGLLSPVGSLRWAYKNYNKIRGSTSRFGFKLPAWPEWWRSGPLSAFDAFDDLKQDISSGTRGYAFFAHLELPHSPYILDRHCQPYPRVSDWLGPMVDDPLAPENSGDTRAERYRLYAEQIRCQQLLLRDLLEIFLAATKNTESIIVIHGDHGSRITRRQMVAKERALLSRDDFVDSFSTLFATRVPQILVGSMIECCRFKRS